MPQLSLVETSRIPLDAVEHAELGRLVRNADAAKKACSDYIDKLGQKYFLYATSPDCSIGFESGEVVIREPRRVLKAS